MPRNRWLFLGIPIFLSLVFDRFFGGIQGFQQVGVTYPVWILLVIAGFFILVRREEIHISISSILLAILSLSMALVTFFRQEEFTRLANMALALLVIGLVFLTFKRDGWLYWGVLDTIRSLFFMAIGILGRPIPFMQSLSQETPGDDTSGRYRRSLLSLLRGVLLALPILLLMSLLLMSADMVFADRVEAFFQLFNLNNLATTILRLLFLVIGLAYILCGTFLHTLYPTWKQPEERVKIKPFLGSIEAAVVLFSLEALFLFFVTIQFRYLFGGELNISQAGYTYSEYARRGFGELVSVTILSLLLYWVLAAVTRQDTLRKKISFRVLAVILHALVLVILISAFQRLSLYESSYGLTHLRAYTHIFIVWLGILLLLVIALEFSGKRDLFLSGIMLVACGFAISLGIVNVEQFISRQNIERTVQGSSLDIEYMRRLSVDAVPELVRQYHSSVVPDDVRVLLGVELVCRTEQAEDIQSKRIPWTAAFQRFNMADRHAFRLLEQNKKDMEEFTVRWDETTEQWGVIYQNEFYECAPDLIQRSNTLP